MQTFGAIKAFRPTFSILWLAGLTLAFAFSFFGVSRGSLLGYFTTMLAFGVFTGCLVNSWVPMLTEAKMYVVLVVAQTVAGSIYLVVWGMAAWIAPRSVFGEPRLLIFSGFALVSLIPSFLLSAFAFLVSAVCINVTNNIFRNPD